MQIDLAAVFLLVARWFGRRLPCGGAWTVPNRRSLRSDPRPRVAFGSRGWLRSLGDSSRKSLLAARYRCLPISKDARCGSPGDADQTAAGKVAEEA